MGRPSRMLESLRAAIEQRVYGLTDMQRLFLFGKLSGLNDKDAAIAAGYSVSVAENTKQRIWKPRARAEFERFQRVRGTGGEPEESGSNDETQENKD
jgi:hypothetical protein